METFKPAENGNIQMYFKGLTAGFSIKTNGTTCIINWGDGTTENANGMGTIYKHTYNADDFYQVEISNCKEVSYCRPAGAKLVAYWSIGNSKTKNLSFGNDKDIVYVGDIFKNDTERTDFSQCLSGCSSLVSFHSGLFDSCEKATSFRYCFGRCGNLTSIPEGLFDNCLEVTNFSECFHVCESARKLPELWLKFYNSSVKREKCFEQCISASNYSSVPVSWGGTAPEYVPPVVASGVSLADYRAINARLSNIEEKLNLN